MDKIAPFRFWVQAVLPVVYDDSLSYYELLCKVVERLNAVIERTNAFDDFYKQLLTAYDELVQRIDEYLENIDYVEVIDQHLDEMAEDGTLTSLMQPLISTEVSTWLEEHIEPTSPAVDNSLTVEGAAADAYATGQGFRFSMRNRTALTASDDLNNIIQVGYYYKAAGVTVGHGVNANGARILMFQADNVTYSLVQIWIDAQLNIIYHRSKGSPTGDYSEWTDWERVVTFRELDNTVYTRGTLASGTDMNNVNQAGYYYKVPGISVVNGVNANTARILMFSPKNGTTGMVQVWYDCQLNNMYFRTRSAMSGTYGNWTSWKKVSTDADLERVVANRTSLTSGIDMNDVLMAGFYYKDQGVTLTNGVNSNNAKIVTFNLSTSNIGLAQLWFDTRQNMVYFRTRFSNSWNWSDWRKIELGYGNVLYAFGTCLTKYYAVANEYCRKINCENTTVTSACGLLRSNVSCAKDICRIYAYGTTEKELIRMFSVYSDTIPVRGTSTDRTITLTQDLNNTWYSLSADYKLILRKLGQLNADSSNPAVWNNAVVAEYQGKTIVACTMGSSNVGDCKAAMKKLVEESFAKLADPTHTISEITTCYSAFSCELPSFADCACGRIGSAIYAKNETESYPTASLIKALTCSIMLDNFTGKDMYESITIQNGELYTGNAESLTLYVGDSIELIDCAKAAMYESSNTCADLVGRAIGQLFLSIETPNKQPL